MKVKRGDEYDEVTFDDGWSMAFSAKAPARPKVGTILAITMDGNRRVGYSINGIVCEDADPLAVHLRDAKDSLTRELKQVEAAMKDLAAKKERVKLLPVGLRERILRFRAANLDFVWRYEDYEMASSMEAARIAAKFKTDAEILAWSKLPWDEQKKQLPDMDERHCGNTFDFAILLARCLVTGQDVSKLPPSITPMVGKGSFGDWVNLNPAQLEAVA